jgi:cytochrome c peroxidase
MLRQIRSGGAFAIAAVFCTSTFFHAADEKSPASFELKIPLGLDPQLQYIPENNPLTAEKIALGKMLYFDKRLSADNSVACATCHDPKFGFTDGKSVSTGINGQQGGRSAPTVINRLFSDAQFWDGRAESLEAQALGPIQNPIEMGNTLEAVVKTLNAIKGYRAAFQRAFGTEVTKEGIAQAIASFERTVLSGNSPYDRFKAGDKTALSESAQRGLTLFESKRVNCIACHVGHNFTDENYRNTGIGMDKEKSDLGRFDISKNDEDRGAFKTPTLRDIARTAPYMHDGSLKTLREVIDFYDKGGIPNPHLSTDMKPLQLTEQEKTDLIAFLQSLTGEMAEITEPKLPN